MWHMALSAFPFILSFFLTLALYLAHLRFKKFNCKKIYVTEEPDKRHDVADWLPVKAYWCAKKCEVLSLSIIADVNMIREYRHELELSNRAIREKIDILTDAMKASQDPREKELYAAFIDYLQRLEMASSGLLSHTSRVSMALRNEADNLDTVAASFDKTIHNDI